MNDGFFQGTVLRRCFFNQSRAERSEVRHVWRNLVTLKIPAEYASMRMFEELRHSRLVSVIYIDVMKPIVVGIAGGSGSGKTTLAHHIVERLGKSNVLLFQHDAYYFDLEQMPSRDPAAINYDHPSSLETVLCADHLRKLKCGETIFQPIYDFATHRRRAETREVHSAAVILVEGILILHEKILRDEMDLRIYVNADVETCLWRRIIRDVAERGRSEESVREQFRTSVLPMFEEFVAPSRKQADIIVPNGGENEKALEVLVEYLSRKLTSVI